jgi:hypothetical protein
MIVARALYVALLNQGALLLFCWSRHGVDETLAWSR